MNPPSVPLLDHLAARIARRDLPPAPPPSYDPNDPAQVRGQVLAALAPLVAGRSDTARLSRAQMLLAFLSHDTRTAADLARAAGLGRVAASHAHNALLTAGLLRWQREGPRRVYRLTRWGEDWLLAVAKGEAPPARPTPLAP